MTDDKAALAPCDCGAAAKRFKLEGMGMDQYRVGCSGAMCKASTAWCGDPETADAVWSRALLPAQRGEGDDVERCARAMMTAEYGSHVPVSKIMRKRAERAIAALPRSTEGWVMVPREPTQEQVDAGRHEIGQMLDSGDFALIAKAVYRAMLAASPAAPAAGAERSGDDTVTLKTSPAALRRHADLMAAKDDPDTATALRWAASDIEALSAPDATITSTVERMRSALEAVRVRLEQSLQQCRDGVQVAELLDDYPAKAHAIASGLSIEPLLHQVKDALATGSRTAGDGEP